MNLATDEVDELFGERGLSEVQLLLDVLRTFDPTLAAHANDVGTIATAVAVDIDLPIAEVARIRQAGRLHDIGMICVAQHILCKPGALDENEQRSIACHPLAGEKLLVDNHHLRALAPLVRHHHEHVDGNGYPSRLIGDDIPIGSRVIAVADAFHAMTMPHPYAITRNPLEVVIELRACAEKQFDPDVVTGLISVLRKGLLEVRLPESNRRDSVYSANA